MLPLNVILHPTDFSPLSDLAFHMAYSLARDHGGRLIVMHVAEPPIVGNGGAMTPPPEGDRQSLEKRLHQVQAPDDKVPIAYRLEVGNPAEEILRLAKESQCDLIVLGSHGRGGLARLLMGSVAEPVVRKATCPILVVKTPQRDSP